MTALIDPIRPAGPRHRRPDEDPTDEVGVPVAGGWLDPDTAPLAVYRDRDLPYAPLAVQRDRARVAPAALPGSGPAVAPPSGAVPVPVTPVARATPVPPVPPPRAVAAMARTAAAPVDRLGRAVVSTAVASAAALIDRLGRARVAAVALIAVAVVLVAVAAVLPAGGPPSGRPDPAGAATSARAHPAP